MSSKDEKSIDIGAVSIVLAVALVIVSIVWVAVMNVVSGCEKSGDGITWVG